MRLTVTASGSEANLKFDFMGTCFTASALGGRQLTICEQDGCIHVQVTPEEAGQMEETSPPAEVAEAQAFAEADSEAAVRPQEETAAEAETSGERLYDGLVALRSHIAKETQRKSYLIFHDETLHQISSTRPASLTELRSIKGIGKAKAEAYGSLILDVVRSGKFEETEVS